MPATVRSQILTLQSADILIDNDNVGGTANLPLDDGVEYYIVKGNATLSSSLTIQADINPNSDVSPIYRILYCANMVLGVNTLTIFGQTVDAKVAAGQITLFEGFWDGSAYQCSGTTIKGGIVNGVVEVTSLAALPANTIIGNNTGGSLIPTALTASQVAAMIQSSLSIPTGSIANGAVTTAKLDQTLNSEAVTTATLRDAAVTNAKMANMAGATIKGKVSGAAGAPQDLTPAQAKGILGLSVFALHIPISFDAGYLGNNNYVMIPVNGTITRWGWSVADAIEATDDGSIEMNLPGSFGGAIGGVVDTLTAISGGGGSCGANTVAIPLGTNAPNNYISFKPLKTTPGGNVILSLLIDTSI